MASTVAMATRRRSPIESWWGARSAAWRMRTASSATRDARQDLAGLEALVERAEGDVFVHGGHEELVVGVLEDQPDAGADVVQRVAGDGEPGDLEHALAGHQAVEVVHEGGLAGPVGAEQRDALAVLDVQVDAAQRLAARPGSGRPARAAWIAQRHAAPPITRRGTTARHTAATKATSARPSDSGASCGMAPR